MKMIRERISVTPSSMRKPLVVTLIWSLTQQTFSSSWPSSSSQIWEGLSTAEFEDCWFATPTISCHKEPARASKALVGSFCLLLTGSVWHTFLAYNRIEDNGSQLSFCQKEPSFCVPRIVLGDFGCQIPNGLIRPEMQRSIFQYFGPPSPPFLVI